MLCNPFPAPAFSVDDGSGYEVNGVLGVRVRMTRPACTSVKVHLATENDNPVSAVAVSDYTPPSVDVASRPRRPTPTS